MTENSNQLPTLYQSFIHLSRYSRWLDDKGRRETWKETVQRYMDFFQWHLKENHKYNIPQNIYDEVREAILSLNVMPSMRALMTAGEALKRDNIANYNCSFIHADRIRALDEMLYVLLNGVGVGFSVERQFVQKLPILAEEFYPTDTVIVVADSKLGWAKAYKELLSLLVVGQIPKWDLSKVRPAGSRLKTFGGRSCLTGDTIVYKDRKKPKGYNEITIKELFDMERSQGFWTHKPNHFKQVKIRSLDEETGEFYRNNVITVIDNGTAPTYTIITENGYRIKATGNHRFMKETGLYDYVDNFNVGDLIAVNGKEKKPGSGTCLDCGQPIVRRAIRCVPCFNKHQIKDDATYKTARQRKECKDYRKDYCEKCNRRNTRFEVHHIDENPHNNDHSNLENLCCFCHKKQHIKTNTFGDSYSHKFISYDKIISMEFNGVEQVYDLQMEAPNHNFVANGFVSHNSGPVPLDELFKFTTTIFREAAGRKLTSFEMHKLFCKIADVVVVGGVRRASLISLSNLSDIRMRHAKSGQWWVENPELALSNNSTSYTEKPDPGIFMEEWLALYNSKSGERGIFNREAAIDNIKRVNDRAGYERRDTNHEFGVNPCGEIILRDKSFCNLSEVIVRQSDNIVDLKNKIRIATILGTWQATLTDFKYVSQKWKDNCDEERLLGVSMTGIMDNEITNGNLGKNMLIRALNELRSHATEVNKEFAKIIGINEAAAITCVKPSGNTSQLCNSSSGIHARYSPYYVRSVRVSKMDPIAKFMVDRGFPHEPDVTKPDQTLVFQFPIKSPKNAITRTDKTATQQLEFWMIYKDEYCDHNPSCTINVKEKEWPKVGGWVFDHFDKISGVTFLPSTEHSYKQAPYQECTKEEYERLKKEMPTNIDWTEVSQYETTDNTEGSQILACTGSSCEI